MSYGECVVAYSFILQDCHYRKLLIRYQLTLTDFDVYFCADVGQDGISPELWTTSPVLSYDRSPLNFKNAYITI